MWKFEYFCDICCAIERQVELQIHGYEVSFKRNSLNQWCVGHYDDELIPRAA